VHGRDGGRKPKLDAKKLKAAQALRDDGPLSMVEIAEQVGGSRSALNRNLAKAGS
jgi:DNA-binding Lrp family transcriptional regulator